jgi:hypothetical protein
MRKECSDVNTWFAGFEDSEINKDHLLYSAAASARQIVLLGFMNCPW